MSYEVRQLLSGLGSPVLAFAGESIKVALDRMVEKDFSQLPVIKGEGANRQFFLISSDSILSAMNSFGPASVDQGLLVTEAVIRVPKTYTASDNLFDLLEGMKGLGAALIVEGNELAHIVTSYDTATFFRQWAEDMMHARDVEVTLKQIITAAFRTSDGVVDEEARQSAIDDLTSSNKDTRKKFDRALGIYLKLQTNAATKANPIWIGKAFLKMLESHTLINEELNEDIRISEVSVNLDDRNSDASFVQSRQHYKQFHEAINLYLNLQAVAEALPNKEWSDEAFTSLHNPKEGSRLFKDLTLDTYRTLFFHADCWSRCEKVISLPKASVNFLLSGVQETRNKLAHFREDEIMPRQRQQLKQCADWLSQNKSAVLTAFEKTAPDASSKGVFNLHQSDAEAD